MDQVLALEHGGDDYITKPFSLDVVIAKVKAVLRRTYGEYSMGEADTSPEYTNWRVFISTRTGVALSGAVKKRI